MEINYVAVLAATVAQFIFGAIWYMPIFGKTWGKIHGFDQVSPEKQKEMMSQMWPLLVAQFVFTFVTTVVFAIFLNNITTDWSIYMLAFMFWLGFVLPIQVAAVLFGGTKEGWVLTKIAIMAIGELGCLLILAFVLNMF